MTQQSTPATGKASDDIELRAQLAASLLAARTGRTPAARSPRGTGLGRKLADVPPPPPAVNDPLYAANVLVLVGTAAHWAQIAPWWFLAGGGATAISAAIATHARLYHRPATLYAGACALAAGAVAATGAEYGALGGLAAAALLGGVVAPFYGVLRRRHSKQHEKERKVFEEIRAERKREDWEDVLRAAGVTDTRIERELNNEVWTDGERKLPAAFALAIELGDKAPEGRALAAMTPKIEQIAAKRFKLPIRSGSIQVNPRRYAHQWELIVPTRDLLREDVPFVLETGPRSVNDTLYVAMANDGTGIGPNLMTTPHGMFAGMTGFGKTTFLNAHAVELTRCVDNVTWMICGKKPARLLRPWMEAFLKGTPSAESGTGYVEPVIDWIATDIHEACMMLLDLYKAIHIRQGAAAEDDAEEKWIPTRERPRITLLIDEAPKFLMDRTLRVKPFDWNGKTDEQEDEAGVPRTGWCFSQLLVEVIVAARSEGISVIFLTQRGTNDLVGDEGGTLKSQVSYRVSLKQAGALEQGKTFISTTVGCDVTKLGMGELYAEVGDVSRPVLGKGYYPRWDDIRAASIAHTGYAQPIDPGTAAGLDFYAERWTRPNQQEFLRSLVTNAVRTVPGQPPERSDVQPQDSARQIPDVPRSIAEDQIEQTAAELDTSVAALRAMLPELGDLDVNGIPDEEEPPPIPWGARIDPTLHQYTRALLDLIASAGLLHGEWITSQEILDLAVRELPDWPTSTPGYWQVKWALEQAGIEQPKDPPRIGDGSRKRRPRGYHVRDLKRALDRFLRREGDDPAE